MSLTAVILCALLLTAILVFINLKERDRRSQLSDVERAAEDDKFRKNVGEGW